MLNVLSILLDVDVVCQRFLLHLDHSRPKMGHLELRVVVMSSQSMSTDPLANALRALAMDAVQQANSGHPGMPMGMADVATELWLNHFKHHPGTPGWSNRDRFVLSNGHGSMLQYGLLHLSGYDLSLDDLKQFRQLHSKTPGHPELYETPGVETTTGPLGQGFANAVGMALAEKILAATFNRDGFPIVDHYTYAFMGDGCLMEGVSHEAASLAGCHGLGKLICFWDDNQISIDGQVEPWFNDNTAMRFKSYGWHVIEKIDGHDRKAIGKAITMAQAEKNRPTLICTKTVIGYGSPNKANSASSHGSPLGDDEIALTKRALNWPYGPFEIPDEVYQAWNAHQKGQAFMRAHSDLQDQYQKQYPQLYQEYQRRVQGQLPQNWDHFCQDALKRLAQNKDKVATRKSSLLCLNELSEQLPELLGGSADLSGSNCTQFAGAKLLSKEDDGNYMHYGVREFGMAAMMNGMALHQGFIPYGGTFLVFSDYCRNAMRLSAYMKQRVIYVMTHDSIGLGEDGPTHQPIEHLSTLRLIPGLSVWRPCDTSETWVAWQQAIENNGPSVLALSRQGLMSMDRTQEQLSSISRGGYVLKQNAAKPQVVLVATGSEVELVAGAFDQLVSQGVEVSVVSMPCLEVFLSQPKAYRDLVLPHSAYKVVVEAGATALWHQLVQGQGAVLGIDEFGLSAPAKDLYVHFQLTTAKIVDKVHSIIKTKIEV